MQTIEQEIEDSSIGTQEANEQIPAKTKELLLLCDRPQEMIKLAD